MSIIRDLVIENRSYRSFDESRRIGLDDLRELVDTARLCPSAVNRQPLRYRPVYEPDEVEEVLGFTHWAGLLPDVKLPPDGHHPTAFIVLCCDRSMTAVPLTVYTPGREVSTAESPDHFTGNCADAPLLYLAVTLSGSFSS